MPQGADRRPDAKCPICRSLERDRLTSIVLGARRDLTLDHKSLLHIAPERALAAALRDAKGVEYVSGDLFAADVSVRLDVQRLPFADRSFDVVYCSHVLEHVDDDRVAMREIRRVLRDDGWAILLVPIDADATDEDPECVDPAERRRRFGQEDHVRAYGPDYVDRLRGSGFAVESITADGVMSEAERHSMSVPSSETLFVCRPTPRPLVPDHPAPIVRGDGI